ncbi:MAG: class I SAM-dependent methyltransferase [Candidatus Lambdaproteobacteria bacterium]|nr:class I SAM-dependent methyltransferase [Candidatus Lambdaproteobacteria bacterium]
MGFWSDQVVPRMVHVSMKAKPVAEVRGKALAAAGGTVLEVGFGSGLNLAHYPAGVTRLLAVEPSEVARGLARRAIARAPFPVEFAGLDGQRMVVPDGSVDCVVTTWTLCTIPKPELALAEFARVLKPQGTFVFAEHGLSPDPGVARWQGRLNGLQQRLAGGCQLTRDIAALIEASPLKLTALENFYIAGPRTHTYFYVGAATRPE